MERAQPGEAMVVVNLADFDFEFTRHGIYTCPTEMDGFRASYKHYPARYAGIYINKGCPFVAEVEAVVRLRSEIDAVVLWKFSDRPDDELVAEAVVKRKGAKFERTGMVLNRPPCLIFLFSAKRRTNFVYDVRGGLQGSRQYFDLRSLEISTIDELAAALRETTWSVLPKLNGGGR